ncbi:hypothetical protein [Methylophaga sp.]|uniref:hypothetical protein n=1 Tax=Methylophaga sp. TaxID=2024840 RepID=UPI003A90238F
MQYLEAKSLGPPVPAAAYEALIDKLDDMELAQIVGEREEQPSQVVALDEL